jgi:large conductance mechanosensitive channel
MWKEFRLFMLRGNVLELAVAVILGAAFGRVITSLVEDLVMPPIGLALGGVDFKNLFIDLSGRGYATLPEAQAAGAPTLRYGVFINTVINFLIVAAAIFLLVRQVNRFFPSTAPPAAPITRDCPFCLSPVPLNARRCAHCTSELTPAG